MAQLSTNVGASSADESRRTVPPTPAATAGGIPEASRQLRALAALSGSLTDALTPEEASTVVEQQALAVLCATSAIVVTLGEFPQDGGRESSAPKETATPPDRSPPTMTLVHAIGLPPPAAAAALTDLWLDASVPLAEVARTGEPVFLRSE